jgi:hypothetical protein
VAAFTEQTRPALWAQQAARFGIGFKVLCALRFGHQCNFVFKVAPALESE